MKNKYTKGTSLAAITHNSKIEQPLVNKIQTRPLVLIRPFLSKTSQFLTIPCFKKPQNTSTVRIFVNTWQHFCRPDA